MGENATLNNLTAKGYFLTKCQTSENIKIIDFSHCYDIYQMLRTLNVLNVNVLTNDFKTYEERRGPFSNSFSFLRVHCEDLENETDSIIRLKILNKIKVFPEGNVGDVGLFGQRLTDFDNGINFKKKCS
ncbi:MAG: hypothetical protein ACQEWG_16665 [Bacteroidota bacterium]